MISREISSGARTSCMSSTSVSLPSSQSRKPRLWAARMPFRFTVATVRSHRFLLTRVFLQSRVNEEARGEEAVSSPRLRYVFAGNRLVSRGLRAAGQFAPIPAWRSAASTTFVTRRAHGSSGRRRRGSG